MAMPTNITSATPFSPHLLWAGYLLGFALGGFFDGILLHQVLQWHHLLTAVERPPFKDIKIQLLADGIFHVLMYVIAIVALRSLWKAKQDYAVPNADRMLLANVFIGFGTWHILDGVLSHWILSIHHIRMDSEHVLLWDLLWFFTFGVAFVLIGWCIRNGRGKGGGSKRSASATALLLAITIAAAGLLASLPPANVSTVLVFFKPGTAPLKIFAGINAVDGRILWAARTGDVWALDISDKQKTSLLYKYGAYLVSSSPLAIGCLAWTNTQV